MQPCYWLKHIDYIQGHKGMDQCGNNVPDRPENRPLQAVDSRKIHALRVIAIMYDCTPPLASVSARPPHQTVGIIQQEIASSDANLVG
ncbi:hypothetical protein [Novacetimonas hansenii]|uniref:hypothetical protein n=1 Tax=Novacetimonas hansenii TaxID=436 RepID=UPI0011C12355|nr:hypothetical protein [Novacetimonas hansenii]